MRPIATSKYLSIADDLRQQIIAGRLPPGARFPTLAEIQEQYEVAEGTAYQATRVLLNEGLIVTKPGAQTRVRERPEAIRMVRSWYRESRVGSPWHADMAAQGRVGSWDARTVEENAPPAIAERLLVMPGDAVTCTSYVYKTDGKPTSLATSWEPLAITRNTPIELPDGGEYRWHGLVERMAVIGIKVTSVVEEIVPRPLTVTEARQLDLRQGIPIIVIERTYFAGERPVETANLVIAPTYRPRYEIPIRGVDEE